MILIIHTFHNDANSTHTTLYRDRRLFHASPKKPNHFPITSNQSFKHRHQNWLLFLHQKHYCASFHSIYIVCLRMCVCHWYVASLKRTPNFGILQFDGKLMRLFCSHLLISRHSIGNGEAKLFV